jgi:hypothetical protein
MRLVAETVGFEPIPPGTNRAHAGPFHRERHPAGTAKPHYSSLDSSLWNGVLRAMTREQWVIDFGAALQRLRPHLSADMAQRIALAHHNPKADPVKAARAWHAQQQKR